MPSTTALCKRQQRQLNPLILANPKVPAGKPRPSPARPLAFPAWTRLGVG